MGNSVSVTFCRSTSYFKVSNFSPFENGKKEIVWYLIKMIQSSHKFSDVFTCVGCERTVSRSNLNLVIREYLRIALTLSIGE